MEQSRPSTALSTSTDLARAEFSRLGTESRLHVEYDVPRISVDSRMSDRRAAVAAACAQEIAFVQGTINQLLNGLLSQLPPSIGMADLGRRPPYWDEERAWSVDHVHLEVQPHRSITDTKATTHADLPDAHIVRAAFLNLSYDRELAIQDVYRQLAEDVSAKTASQKLEE